MKEKLATDDMLYQLLKQIDSKTISYQSYKQLGQESHSNLKKYFSAKNFLILQRNESGEIEREDFIRLLYILRCNNNTNLIKN
jgi:hypothetical protein